MRLKQPTQNVLIGRAAVKRVWSECSEGNCEKCGGTLYRSQERQAAANINFRAAEAPLTADILIGAEVEPVGWAFANVSYKASSKDRPKPILRSLICLNPLRRWKVGFNGDLKSYDLRYAIAHEIGHAIGLDHPATGDQIMGYRYEEQFLDLQPGDIAGAVLLYGRRRAETTTAHADQPVRLHRSPIVRIPGKPWGTRAFPKASR
jgi:Matrixin